MSAIFYRSYGIQGASDLEQIVSSHENILVVGSFNLLAQGLNRSDDSQGLRHSRQPRHLVRDRHHTDA